MNHIPPIRNMETISIFSKNFAPPLYPIIHISTAFFHKHAKLHTITETLILSRKTAVLSRKLIYKHENSEQFPCLYYIPRLSTVFSVKLIRLSPKTNNILHPFTFPLYTITEPPDFCVKVYFCLIVRFFRQSPSYQQRTKHKKAGSTTHRDEPRQTSKSPDLKPFIIYCL